MLQNNANSIRTHSYEIAEKSSQYGNYTILSYELPETSGDTAEDNFVKVWKCEAEDT